MAKLILVRHGQSLWNKENRFTGWVDVPLTEEGREEARKAGVKLGRLVIHTAYTSCLKRAQETLNLIMLGGGFEVPVIADQALNERHYGDLQGLNKAETAEKFGADQVKLWRRSYDIAPPNGEALVDTAARTIPFFERAICGDLKQGKNVLVVAHGNSNRAIVMKLEGLSKEEILEVELETGVPLVFDLDAQLNVTGKHAL